jgi:5-methylcytosine-specific restriction endonuclease McrA
VLSVCVDCTRTFAPFTVRGRPSARCHRHALQHIRNLDAQHADRNRATGRAAGHWQHVRAQVLRRDGYRCRMCRQPGRSVHLDPRLRSNHHAATVNDCVTLCTPCHASLGDPANVPGGVPA